MKLPASLALALAVACGGSAPAPETTPDPPETEAAPTPAPVSAASADPLQRCKDIDAAIGSARKIEVGLEDFTSEGGFGEAWVNADNKVLKLTGDLAGEGGNREIVYHYDAGVPVCVWIKYNHYSKPIFEEGGGEVDGVDVYMRVYNGEALVHSAHNDGAVAIADDSSHTEELEEAVRIGKHAEAVARGEVDQ